MDAILVIAGCFFLLIAAVWGPRLTVAVKTIFSPGIQATAAGGRDPLVLLCGESVEIAHTFRRAMTMSFRFPRFVIILGFALLCALAALAWPTHWLLILTAFAVQAAIICLLSALESPVSMGASMLESSTAKRPGRFFGIFHDVSTISYATVRLERDILAGLLFRPLRDSADLSGYPRYLMALRAVLAARRNAFISELDGETTQLLRRYRLGFYAAVCVTAIAYFALYWGIERTFPEPALSARGIDTVLLYVLATISTAGGGDAYSVGLGVPITILFLLDLIALIFGVLQFFGDALRHRVERAFAGYIGFLDSLIGYAAVLELVTLEGRLYDNWEWLVEHYRESQRARDALRMHDLHRTTRGAPSTTE